MEAKLEIDTGRLAEEITQKVLKSLKPILAKIKAMDDTIFTVKTLAEYLNVSDQFIYDRVHLNEIPYIKVGKFPRFRKSKIDSWLDSLEALAILCPGCKKNKTIPFRRKKTT